MRLEFYIGELLYRYQCVTVPGFGAFLSNYKSAQVHQTTNAFYPPTKVLAFNAQLTSNDGLLTKYIADAEKMSYETVLSIIEKEVELWNTMLQEDEKIELKNIGELWLENDKILFSPSYHINYLTSSFGLSSFVSPAISRTQMKEEVEVLEEKAPILFTPEKRKQPSYLKYAAIAVIATTVVGAFGYKYQQTQFTQQQLVTEQNVQDKVDATIQQATFFETSPVELPTVTLNVTKETYKYHIIAGAFREEINAKTKVEQLKNEGFEAAAQIGQNKYGLYQVSYIGFHESDDAVNFLNTLRKVEPNAWLFVAKE